MVNPSTERINMKNGSTMVKSISGIECNLRKSDGYVNATELIKAHNAKTGENRKIAKWLETDRAKAYIEAVAKRCEKLPFDLIETRSGKGGGSWIHPDLAVPFATWLSVEFELQVSDWVKEWMTTGVNPIQKQLSREEIIASLMPSQPLTWQCRYSPDFWGRLEFLYGFKQGNPACAVWINRFIYGYFPQEIRDRLDEINPLIDGRRKNLQHTHFDGMLLIALEQHLMMVFGFMFAPSAKEFEHLMDAKFRGIYQLQLWGSK